MYWIKQFAKLLYTWYYALTLRRKHVAIRHGALCYHKCYLEGYNVINTGCVVANASLGYGTYLGRDTRAVEVKIGRYCSVGANLQINAYTHPSHTFVSTAPCFFSLGKQCGMTYVDHQKFDECRSISGEKYHVLIGNDVWIGNNVTILGGCKVGDGAILATGCIVTKDVPPYAIVAGVPAKVIRYRFEEEQIRRLLAIRWWDRDGTWIAAHSDAFDNIEKFLKTVEQEEMQEKDERRRGYA